MSTAIAGLLVIGFYFTLVGTIVYGWFLNLQALLNIEPWIWSAKSIIGIIGIPVPPLGAIMGYFIW